MDLLAAKNIGAGIAMIALAGVGIGLGNLFAAYLSGIARNPAVEGTMFSRTLLGAALTEAIALFALVIAILILFT